MCSIGQRPTSAPRSSGCAVGSEPYPQWSACSSPCWFPAVRPESISAIEPRRRSCFAPPSGPAEFLRQARCSRPPHITLPLQGLGSGRAGLRNGRPYDVRAVHADTAHARRSAGHPINGDLGELSPRSDRAAGGSRPAHGEGLRIVIDVVQAGPGSWMATIAEATASRSPEGRDPGQRAGRGLAHGYVGRTPGRWNEGLAPCCHRQLQPKDLGLACSRTLRDLQRGHDPGRSGLQRRQPG